VTYRLIEEEEEAEEEKYITSFQIRVIGRNMQFLRPTKSVAQPAIRDCTQNQEPVEKCHRQDLTTESPGSKPLY
jgi:hypothetical protein